MENLNAEQIKKALEHCIGDATCDRCSLSPFTCHIQENALTLIKSQEQRIKALTEENERLRAEQVKHGQWMQDFDEVTCSVCGAIHDVHFMEYDSYCPNCGAKNEGDIKGHGCI